MRSTLASAAMGLGLGVLLLHGIGTARAAMHTYRITPGDETEVVFQSSAPLETFEGSTDQVEGAIVLDPEALGDSLTVEISVDLASLDTGIGLRNRHMRENHLHTERFPEAVFRGASLRGELPDRLASGETVTVRAAGSFSLHGVTRRMETDVRLTLDEAGRTLRIETEFEVFLEDHEIPRPKMLFMKLDEKQKVRLVAVAEAEGR